MVTFFMGVTVLAGFAAVAVFAYKEGVRHGAETTAPVITASSGPDKIRPDEPGGMSVPNQDKQIYERISPDTATRREERLLPGPEVPVAPPQRPAPSADQANVPLAPASPTAASAAPKPAAPGSAAAKPRDTVEPPSITPPAGAARPAPAKPEPSARETTSATSAAPASGGGYRVQLASLRSAEDAQATIARYKKSNGDLLGALAFDVRRADLGEKGVYYRVVVGPLADASAATNLCEQLKTRKLGCMVVKP